MTTRLLVLAACLALAGCASAPVFTADQIQAADVGPMPGEAEQATIRAAMAYYLKDPASAQYQWGEPRKSSLSSGGRTVIGWVVPVLVNARNSYGGYVGFEQWGFFMVNGRIVSHQTAAERAIGTWGPLENL